MGNHITDKDKKSISEFLATPKYQRRPELLIPDSDE